MWLPHHRLFNSYFELSVTQRGSNAKHHTTLAYALSMAAIIRAQVRGGRGRVDVGCAVHGAPSVAVA